MIFYLVCVCAFILCGWYLWRNVSASRGRGLILKSKNFINNDRFDKVHTCDGQDLSPHLAWHGAPANTKSYALICSDPDAPAGIWVHWILYNIPANIGELEQGVSGDRVLENGALQGINSWGRFGYGGACPPKGHGQHRYYFYLYALDTMLKFDEDMVDKDMLERAMQRHVLATAQIMGTYSRE
ncbi:MAG: YbhB/YbcL family Raf kinase inhibitor-like protein [Epsilonproteobacteria bacterium]|nr:YbhB/YbcL family Raf kinase inhibitor-like protein [Campylobacterota bacterium]